MLQSCPFLSSKFDFSKHCFVSKFLAYNERKFEDPGRCISISWNFQKNNDYIFPLSVVRHFKKLFEINFYCCFVELNNVFYDHT